MWNKFYIRVKWLAELYIDIITSENSLWQASLVAQWLRIACQSRGHGFKPWSGKIPHAAEQLSPCATTTEPVCHNY